MPQIGEATAQRFINHFLGNINKWNYIICVLEIHLLLPNISLPTADHPPAAARPNDNPFPIASSQYNPAAKLKATLLPTPRPIATQGSTFLGILSLSILLNIKVASMSSKPTNQAQRDSLTA